MNKTIYFLLFIILSSTSLFGQEYERYKKLLDTTLVSEYLGFVKQITITVPFEWQENLDQEFPLIVIFDRQNQRSHKYILNAIDYLTSNEQMPSSVVVSFESEQIHRYRETLHKASSEKALALENEKFVFDELIPMIERKFNAGSFRLFIGHSRYGYFTTSLFCSRPNELNGVISISPFFSQKDVDLTDSVAKLNTRSINSNTYYRFGIGNDYPSDYYKMDSTLKQLENSRIDAKGVLFKEADHNVTPGLTIGTALYEIFEYWSSNQSKYIDNKQKDLSILPLLRKNITDHYGCDLKFSLGILNGKGWYFYGEADYGQAIEAWDLLLESYPNFSEAYLYVVDAQLQMNIDYSQTTKDFHESLKKSMIYNEQEKEELIVELNNLIHEK